MNDNQMFFESNTNIFIGLNNWIVVYINHCIIYTTSYINNVLIRLCTYSL